MLRSMTGFGRAEQTIGDKTYLVEIKSLNGKQLEINLKIPAIIKPYEFDIRNLIQEFLIRGSVECLIVVKQNGSSKPVIINTDLIKSYYKQIEELASELSIDTNSVLSAILRLPEVISPSNEVLDANDWNDLKKVIEIALNELNTHRIEEGKKEILSYAKNTGRSLSELIENYLDTITQDTGNEKISPKLRKIVGAVKLPKNFDDDKELRAYLEKKHL